ncbi:conserved hypothetical protein [delta proteobacterium NaphS2]|nr:conserved hypothetical protein [delta proteobacterium NaphS2]
MAEFKFGFEEAWFRLIIKKLPDHPDLFLPREVEKAQAVLRVGKLKVGAAKAWAQCAEIIEKKKNGFFLSPLGQLISRHDPDLEEDGIWCLIHYHLARSGSPAWFYSFYFNQFELDEFTREQFEAKVRAHWDDLHEKPMTDSVFHKLIFPPFKQVFEGTRLGEAFGFWLANEDGSYCRHPFNAIPVPKAILAYALIDWGRQNDRQSVHFEKLLEPGGIGRIFRLERETLDTLLVDIGEVYQKQAGWISHTAGLNSVSITGIPQLAMVSAYYHELDGGEPADALSKGLKEVKALFET